ncbi:MAG TPA: TRAP transporter substrate-binding protein [Burkholderiales bacterium]|nr:TRAP transporter substrate-binding protein [Burkholderiales bacterium]
MKTKLLSIAAAAFVAVLLGASGVSQAAPEVTLKFHHFLPPVSAAQRTMIEPWARAVEKSSGGKIKIDIYPSMSLGGTPPQLIRQVRDGVVDIVWTLNGYTAGQFPRTEVFELPFVHTNNAVATNLAMYDMFDQYLKPEWSDVKVILLHVHAGNAIQMVNSSVNTSDDLKGKKIRIPSRTGAWLLEALGANPVGMPVPALPQALSKRVVDGALVPFEIIPPLKLQELTEFQIEGEGSVRFGTATFVIAMNKNKYESLSAELKKAIDDNSGRDFAIAAGRAWTNNEKGGLAAAQKAGNKYIVLPKAEMDKFKVKLEPVIDRWIADVKGQGVDGRALVDAARKEIAKHSNTR